MKKTLFSIIYLGAICITSAQINLGNEDGGTVTYDDGTEITFELLENDPSNRADWMILGLFCPSYYEGYVNLGATIRTRVNLKDQVDLYLNNTLGYSIDTRETFGNAYDDFWKMYQHHSIGGSIKISEKVMDKHSLLELGVARSGYMETYYWIERDLKVKRRMGALVGLDYTQRRIGTGQKFEANPRDTVGMGDNIDLFYPVNLYQSSIRIGGEVMWIRSTLTKVNDYLRDDYVQSRVYTELLIPFQTSIDVIKTPFAGARVLAKESEYVSPKFSHLGIVTGGEVINDTRKDGMYFGASLEVGILPGIKYENPFDNFTATLGIIWGFGTNLKKHWDTNYE